MSTNRIGNAFNAVILTLLAASTVLPVAYLIYVSLIPPEAYYSYGVVFPPRALSLVNYQLLLGRGSRLVSSFLFTVYVTVVGTVLSTFFSALLAYPLSKSEVPFRIPMTGFVFFTMLFGGGLVPNYLLVRALGLLDTVWALVLPGLISAWNMFIIRNFFQALPDSLEESARLEGAGDLRILLSIVIPLSKAVILTIGLFYAVSYWNKWFDVLIYMRSPNKRTLQLVLRDILYSATGFSDPSAADTTTTTIQPPGEVIKMTAIVISTLPIMLVYPFVQRHFIRGVMIGSIKG